MVRPCLSERSGLTGHAPQIDQYLNRFLGPELSRSAAGPRRRRSQQFPVVDSPNAAWGSQLMNYEQLPIFRTRAQAANSNRRAALDYQFAARWERLGGRPFRSNSPEVLVDLASEGALVEPRGRPLIHCQLFGTQFIRTVMSVGHELVKYQASYGPDHIVFIRIRPSRDPNSKTGPLLDANGNAPLRNLRRVHSVTSTEIQGALEYMQSQQWLSPLVIGRHADPIDGGAAFDWHEHVTAQINPECSKDLSKYLYGKFGRGRVWISSEEEPGVPRDLVRSGCYPAAKLANRGYDDISDENLLEFIAQSHRLRRIEVAGPIRAARDAKREPGLQQAGVASPARGPEAEIAKILADRDDMLSDRGNDILSDGVAADAILSANSDVEPAPPANRPDGGAAARPRSEGRDRRIHPGRHRHRHIPAQ